MCKCAFVWINNGILCMRRLIQLLLRKAKDWKSLIKIIILCIYSTQLSQFLVGLFCHILYVAMMWTRDILSWQQEEKGSHLKSGWLSERRNSSFSNLTFMLIRSRRCWKHTHIENEREIFLFLGKRKGNWNEHKDTEHRANEMIFNFGRPRQTIRFCRFAKRDYEKLRFVELLSSSTENDKSTQTHTWKDVRYLIRLLFLSMCASKCFLSLHVCSLPLSMCKSMQKSGR